MFRNWTPEILDLIETLTCRLRVMSLRQIHRGWASMFHAPNQIIDSVERLVQAGLLVGDVRPLPLSPVSCQPLAVWFPGDIDPPLERLEQHIQCRWDKKPVPTPIVAATKKACHLFGSSAGGMPTQTHLNHDLLLSEVFVGYRESQPEVCASWLGEDAVESAERGVKNPDAFLIDTEGNVIRVIESAGKYSLQQLESFHEHCKLSDLPYELW